MNGRGKAKTRTENEREINLKFGDKSMKLSVKVVKYPKRLSRHCEAARKGAINTNTRLSHYPTSKE